MTTLIEDGARRCDARCHWATGDECQCVCGGRYHGVSYSDPDRLADAMPQPRLPLSEESSAPSDG